MSRNALVPPGTAGWMVRVMTAPSRTEFYFAAIPDEAAAEDAVKARAGASGNEDIEGVATLSAQDLRAQNLAPGEIRRA